MTSFGLVDETGHCARLTAHHGLYLELKKSEREEPTEGQRFFMERAESYGYACYVAGGAMRAVEILKEYLDIECDCVACQLVTL